MRSGGGEGFGELGASSDAELVARVAESMDAPPELVALLPDIMEGLSDLGARARDVSALLAGARFLPGDCGLDLGCGKGAVVLALARAHGLAMHGVDAVPGFIAHAAREAARQGLSSSCTFECADIRARLAEERGGHALVLQLALGELLGPLDRTVAAIRRCVRPGGHIVVDAAYLAPDAPADAAEAFGVEDRQAVVAGLCAHGDLLEAERVVDGPEAQAHYARLTADLAARCERLAARHPTLADALRDFAARQQEAVDQLEAPVVGALFLLRRAA